MTAQPFARSRTLIVASLAVGAAILALAGQASAHRGHHPHHYKGGAHGASGTISSFDAGSGRLTIALSGGDSISGLVTESTRIGYSGGCHGWGMRDRRSHHPRRFGWSHWGWGHGHDATTADLVPGAAVDQALLTLEDGRAVFFAIELEKR